MEISPDQEIALSRAKGALQALEQLCAADVRTGDQVTVNRENLSYLFDMIVKELSIAVPN